MAKPYACTICGHVGAPKRHTRGSFGMEVVLWLLFIFPGLIYSVWRLTTRQDVCEACKSPTLVPTDSPAGRKIVAAREVGTATR